MGLPNPSPSHIVNRQTGVKTLPSLAVGNNMNGLGCKDEKKVTLLSWLSVRIITPLHSYIHCCHYCLQWPTSKEKLVSFPHSLSAGVISP